MIVAARDGKSTRIVRIASFLLVMLAGAMIVCAGVGFAVTQVDDSRLEIERQVTLRQAIEEFRAVSGDVDRIGDPQLRLIERRAGLKGLRFDSDPAGESGREVQSVIDGRGRIVGWFSWVGDRALVHAMNRLWGFAAAVGVALALCALLAARAAQRLARALDRTIETVRHIDQPGHPDRPAKSPRDAGDAPGGAGQARLCRSLLLRSSISTVSTRSTIRSGGQGATRC